MAELCTIESLIAHHNLARRHLLVLVLVWLSASRDLISPQVVSSPSYDSFGTYAVRWNRTLHREPHTISPSCCKPVRSPASTPDTYRRHSAPRRTCLAAGRASLDYSTCEYELNTWLHAHDMLTIRYAMVVLRVIINRWCVYTRRSFGLVCIDSQYSTQQTVHLSVRKQITDQNLLSYSLHQNGKRNPIV